MTNEEAVKWLEHLIDDIGQTRHAYLLDYAEALSEMITMLKCSDAVIQKPRVLTLEELDAIYQTKEWHIWPFNTPPWLWMTVNPDVRQTRGFWICWRDIKYSLENDSTFYVRKNYGKVWKIWTAEPTDEQIKEEAWKI